MNEWIGRSCNGRRLLQGQTLALLLSHVIGTCDVKHPLPNTVQVWIRTTRSSFLNEEIRRTVPTSSFWNNSAFNFAARYPWAVDLDFKVWRVQISTKTAKHQKTHPLVEQTLIQKRLTHGNFESTDWLVMDRVHSLFQQAHYTNIREGFPWSLGLKKEKCIREIHMLHIFEFQK